MTNGHDGEEQVYEGGGRTLDDATTNAFHQARDEQGEGYYRVVATYVFCENPIREYRVKIVKQDP